MGRGWLRCSEDIAGYNRVLHYKHDHRREEAVHDRISAKRKEHRILLQDSVFIQFILSLLLEIFPTDIMIKSKIGISR